MLRTIPGLERVSMLRPGYGGDVHSPRRLNPLSLTPVDPLIPLSLWEGSKGRENGFGESQPCLASLKTTKRVFFRKRSTLGVARRSWCSQSRASQRPSQPITKMPSDPRVGRRLGLNLPPSLVVCSKLACTSVKHASKVERE